MKALRWFFWLAFILSVLLHLGILAAEPIYAWATQAPAAEIKVKKTTRKLQSQQLDDIKAADLLKGVQPVETLIVRLQRAIDEAPVPVSTPEPVKPRPTASKVVASKAFASKVVASKAVASKVAVSEVKASRVASEVASAVAKEWSAASAAAHTASLASTTEAASKASKVSASKASAVHKGTRAATKIKADAAQRFPREVSIEYRYAVATAFLNWKISADNHYELELKVIPLAIRYISRGRIGKEGVMPDYFADISKGEATPKNEVKFDWATMQATIINKGQQTVEPFEAGDQDVMSAALHLALMGGAQPEYSMAIFTGKKRYPDIHYAMKGEGQVRVAGQDMTALLMAADGNRNQADFWLAPDWNNLPVRMIINTEKYGRFDFSAYNLTLDGKKVLQSLGPDPRSTERPR